MTDQLITLRASSLPLAFRCAASLLPCEIKINATDGAAENGTAGHNLLADLPVSGRIDFDAIPSVCERFGADEKDVRIVCALAARLWPEIADSFRGAQTELSLRAPITERVTLCGHIDAVLISGRVARALDWKCGYLDSEYRHQMFAYGTLLFLNYPELEEVTVTVVWVRAKSIENYTMRRADAVAWIDELLRTVVRWDGVYRPSPKNCGHCHRSHECEAGNAMVRRDVAALSDYSLVARAECEMGLMSPEQVVELFQKAKLVSAYAGRVIDAVKKTVLDSGDIIANGARLTIETQEKRKLDTLKAWPILDEEGFTDADFAEVIDISISRLEGHVAKRAGRGRGAAAKRALAAKLADAGAIEIQEIKKLEQRRAGT